MGLWLWLVAGDHGCWRRVCFVLGNGKNGNKLLKSDLMERKESPQLPQNGLGCLEPVCLQC